ncbi:ribose-phosphate pyrophosphokinase : Ribose-phosphate pyrophosphokinase OS=Planctomyces brasiliensis (strain ATCC 49424 / DSM 5305 / JCM 21570 / NBRC 103401 / IFAM 1448) GN=prs PE=3 SV=1: Pribosyltran_N: Pribosyl_synth [Gemmataceae bacterium]|nr:ribose-phosphate pyrophosphokinase : Ribose-phosphate pyrophosphokinase OS=Planctomyces brasiliensis (strain ATCC 49424 / DSM 5305 / JCM 21570 / NBRC 103401 / IFAM 1448) GN=prs PE=3 SV=1: Pribosyltran_N: Pribosyl_synth [Gemmataceae bacterium]VTT97827.1 ribose-phosphate pyrophosphokinase : Ribose-phosphate pyrophosphokinase OS=Planctomyces brasiliensis (strain ATCC 49424 / DSM 5305 / JCM 21570 / NBRC 103401 / IFAM 1448) GN=prs PE=3 SV=1: Pribosyltran_N: Pribosyl_synth [Gemmataceae bacterium]
MFGNGNNHKLKIFSGRANRPLAERIAVDLGGALGRIDIRDFPDGETSVRIDEDVRGRDVFIVQPVCTPVNQHLMELLILIDAFKRASPARITAVLPYYGYARQDRKDKGRVPISAKLVANLITKAGADRVLALDLHAAQIQGFFDIPVDHLYAVKELAKHMRSLNIPPDELVVLSPDEGSIKKALDFQKNVGGDIAIINKQRTSATEVKQGHLIGAPLDGKTVVVYDDLISTAGTIVGAVRVAHAHGAKNIYIGATHGVLCGKAIDKLKEVSRDCNLTQIAVTDSVPIPPEKMLPNMKVISVAGLFAKAIQRIHGNESISALFSDESPAEKR